ncbi:tetratricopeptide repeat protein [Streptococcaceae bacterium ESL0729]|nr:tetratricopeptide repeat protein [Streptococcaceae bacterium ESL0729]
MSYAEQMIEALHGQDLDLASELLSQALKFDDREILVDLAEYLEYMGFQEESRRVYDKLISSSSDDTGIYINLASMAADDGDFDKAYEYLAEIPEDDENYLAALVETADLYQMEGFYEAALEKLKEAQRLSDTPLVNFALAELLYSQGNFKAAIDTYVKLDVEEIYQATKISIYQRIGTAYASLGKFELSLEYLEKSLDLFHDDNVLFELANINMELGENKRSIAYFKQLDLLNPDFHGYNYLYAQVLDKEGDYKEAKSIALEGLKKNNQDVPLLHLLSKLSFQLHDFNDAEKYLIQALDFADMHDETVFLLSNLYLDQEDYQAVLNLKSLLDEEHLLSSWNFAKAHLELDEEDEAEEIFDNLKQYLSNNPDFLLDYMELLKRVGRHNDFKNQLEAYLKLVPDDEKMQALLADFDQDWY